MTRHHIVPSNMMDLSDAQHAPTPRRLHILRSCNWVLLRKAALARLLTAALWRALSPQDVLTSGAVREASPEGGEHLKEHLKGHRTISWLTAGRRDEHEYSIFFIYIDQCLPVRASADSVHWQFNSTVIIVVQAM